MPRPAHSRPQHRVAACAGCWALSLSVYSRSTCSSCSDTVGRSLARVRCAWYNVHYTHARYTMILWNFADLSAPQFEGRCLAQVRGKLPLMLVRLGLRHCPAKHTSMRHCTCIVD